MILHLPVSKILTDCQGFEKEENDLLSAHIIPTAVEQDALSTSIVKGLLSIFKVILNYLELLKSLFKFSRNITKYGNII